MLGHGNDSLDHLLRPLEAGDDATGHLLDEFEGRRRPGAPSSRVRIEGVVDKALVQGSVLLVPQYGLLRDVFHDSEPSLCATVAMSIFLLGENLSLDLLHHEWNADVIGHLLQPSNSGDFIHVSQVLLQGVALKTVNQAHWVRAMAPFANFIRNMHDLRKAPVARLFLVGIQVLPETTAATGLPGPRLHSASPVPMESVAGRLKIQRNLSALWQVLARVLALHGFADAVGTHRNDNILGILGRRSP